MNAAKPYLVAFYFASIVNVLPRNFAVDSKYGGDIIVPYHLLTTICLNEEITSVRIFFGNGFLHSNLSPFLSCLFGVTCTMVANGYSVHWFPVFMVFSVGAFYCLVICKKKSCGLGFCFINSWPSNDGKRSGVAFAHRICH